MKKQFFVIMSCAITTALLSSCQKDINAKKDPADIVSTPLPGQSTYCRIESIWAKDYFGEDQFHLVLYDEFENPVAITTPAVGSGSPYRIFKYDQWHRLREYLGIYAYNNYQFWHLYGYDLNGRIGVDTMYVLGNFATGYNDHFQISQIEYDSQNRISKIHSVFSNPNINIEESFEYDAAGNLLRPGVTYDSKANVYRTNDIWMFISKDFSVNNPFIADEYNSSGYPTKINQSLSFSFLQTEISFKNLQVSYGCRQAYW